jgi:serine phosphatase RsbU (regulator of sigma subunit)
MRLFGNAGHQRQVNVIKVALVAGAILGLLLLVESIASYHYVIAQLVPDHMAMEAERHAATLENLVRERQPQDATQPQTIDNAQLRAIVEEFREDRSTEIAWLRVVDRQGTIQAESGGHDTQSFPADVARQLFEAQAPNVIEQRPGPQRGTVIVAVPLRFFRLPQRPPEPNTPPRAGGPNAPARVSEPNTFPRPGELSAPRGPREPNAPGTGERGAAAAVTGQNAGQRAAGPNLPQGPREPNAPPSAGGAPAPPRNAPRGRGRVAGPFGRVAEMALYTGAADPFGPLRRDVAISFMAAAALFAAVVFFYLRLPAYLRGLELEEQLTVARQVQSELFPANLAVTDSLDFSAECIPVWQVGGDYYDVFPGEHGETVLVLGDVAGKGLPAALLMALIHGAIRVVSPLAAERHERSVERLNQILCSRLPGNRFVSLFWACYNPGRSALRYVNAGHPPALLFSNGAVGQASLPASHAGKNAGATGGEPRRLERGGPVLGLFPDAQYEGEQIPVSDTDLLVLYSDGLVEATNAAGADFGEERLIALIRANIDRPAAELRQTVMEEVKRHVGRQPLNDDLTLLVARLGVAVQAMPAAAD